MIVTALFTFVMGLLEHIEPITIPNVAEIIGYFEQGIQLISDGVGLLGLFIGDTGLYALAGYLGAIFLLNMAYLAWQFIWFCIKKIPMLNIRE